MAAETKHVIVPEINKEHRIQIKNTNYSCIYLTHIFYFNEFDLKHSIFCCFKNGVHSLFAGTVYSRKYGTLFCLELPKFSKKHTESPILH
jgi:hypothetical protein